MKDPFVAEVCKHRMAHTRKFGSNLRRICEDLRAFESTLGERVVRVAIRQRKLAKSQECRRRINS